MKKLSTLLIIFAISFCGFAVDFGGSLFNNTSLKNVQSDSALKADQLDELSLWTSIPLNNQGTSSLYISGKYQFEKDFGADTTTNYIDIDTAKFDYAAGNKNITLGRFFMCDLTQAIFVQSLDGTTFGFDLDIVKLDFAIGYTGLLNNHFNSILNETLVAYPEDTDKAYDVAEKFLILKAGVEFPFLFKEQTLSIEDIGTAHLNSDEAFARNYTTIALNGPLANNIFYTLSTTLGISQFDDEDEEISNFSKINATYFGNFKNYTLSFNGVYASGKQGPFKPFRGFTSQTAVNSNGLITEYTCLAKLGLAFSIKPQDNLLVVLNGNTVFDATESIEYHGFEYGADLNYQIVSDVFAGASINQYFDKDNTDYNKTQISLKAIITF